MAAPVFRQSDEGTNVQSIRALFRTHFCIVAFGLTAAVTAAEPADPIAGLEQIRDGLRERCDARLAADAATEAPREFVFTFDKGVGRKGRPMTLVLQHIGGQWAAPRLTGASVDRIDCSGLELVDGQLNGTIRFDWVSAAQEGGELESASQSYRVDARVAQIERRLVLTLHDFLAGKDWQLAYRPTDTGWTFDRDLALIDEWETWGPFERDIPDLVPDADGNHAVTITARRLPDPKTEGKADRHVEAYDENGHPVITFAFTIVHGRVGSTWLRRAAGGKHMLGNATDVLSGAVQTHTIAGTYHATGSAGEWTGDVSGPIRPGQRDTGPLDQLVEGVDRDASAWYAARVYRQIRALDRVLRHYPQPIQAAIDRTLVPDPEIADAETVAVYVEHLHALARSLVAGDPDPVHSGVVRPDDPAFGPYVATGELGDNRLPAHADGPQRWAHPAGWRFCGPFPLFDEAADVRLPELSDRADAAYARERMYIDAEGTVSQETDPAQWIDASVDGAVVAAPPVRVASSGGMRSFVWYARTRIESEAAREVQLALRAHGQVTVWIDDRPVYRNHESTGPQPVVFPVALNAGSNRILVRVASSVASGRYYETFHYTDGYRHRPQGRIDFTSFAMHLCLAGQPGASRAGSTAVAAPADGPRGYRNHWDGRFPEADPPLAFDIEDGTNVAWNVALPLGTADPVIRDGRIYLTAEPHHVFCIDAASGETLWTRQVSVLELEAPELAQAGADRLGDYVAAMRRVANLRWEAKKDEEQRDALGSQADALEAEWADFAQALEQAGINAEGPTAPVAPVVTADAVYVHFGTGVAACFDHAGQRRWLVPTAGWSQDGMGQPVFIDGAYVIQLHLCDGKKEPGTRFAVRALDAADGSTRWTATVPAKRTIIDDRFEPPASPGPGLGVMRLRNTQSGQRRDVIITGAGVVLDAATGELLHRDILPVVGNRGGPYVDGDRVYAVSLIGETAVELWLDDAGRVGARPLWANRHTSGRGSLKANHQWPAKNWMKGPLIHDGRIYQSLVDRAHVPQHYPCPWQELDIWDTATGARLARRRRVFESCTDPTIAPTLAGVYIAVADGGDPLPGFHGTTEYAQLAFLGADVEAFPVTRFRLPGKKLRAAPVFAGSRMYLRLYDGLYCIAVSDAAGEQYVEEVKAQTLFAEIPLREPPPPVKVIPAAAMELTTDAPLDRLHPGTIARSWLACGPIPSQAPGEHLAALGGPAEAAPAPGETITVGSSSYTFSPVEKRHLGIDRHGYAHNLDVLGSVGGKGSSVSYFYCVLENSEVRTMRFGLDGGGVRAWLNGVEITDKDILDLELGTYRLLIRSEVGRLPPFARNSKIAIAPSFTGTDHPALDYAAWASQVEALRDRFEQLIRDHAGTEIASRARLYLQAVATYREQKR